MKNRLFISPPFSGLRAGKQKKWAYALAVPAFHRRAIPAAAFLWMLLCPWVRAQTLVNRGQTIHINSNAVLTVKGGVHNTGFFTNNGTFLLTGDWKNLNSGSYNGLGTLELAGNMAQRIDHSPASGLVNQSFGKVVVAGGGDKIWESNAEIEQELVLQNGIVTPLANVQLIINENADITGGDPTSHINGPLIHRGTGYKFFPIGKNGLYRPASLDQVSGTSLLLGMEAYQDNPNATPGSSLKWVSSQFYWKKEVLSGTFDGGYLTLHYGPEVYGTEARVTDQKDLVVAQANNQQAPYQSAGNEAFSGSVDEGSVTSKEKISGNYFTVAISDKTSVSTVQQKLYFPNTFSPSAANPEEKVWKIYGNQFVAEGFQVRIYNRWGNLIFESESLEALKQTGWDGRNAATGKVENAGVYTYTLKGKLINEEVFQKIGSIHLIP